jgi:hypothetical protein
MFTKVIKLPLFTYTTFSFLLFDSIFFFLNCFLSPNVENDRFFLVSFLTLSFLGLFYLLVSCVLSCYYFSFFLHFCIATTTTITTIISSNVSKGKGTLEKPMVVTITSFCKPKLSISLTCLLSTHRASTH